MNHADRVKDTTTTAGTGNVTVSGTPALRCLPLSTFANGTARVPIMIEGQGVSTEWELVECTILTSTTFSRDTVLASSNSGSLVNFSAGTKDVYCTVSAEEFDKLMVSETIAYTTTIPLTQRGLTYMAQHTITGATTFTASTVKVTGAFVSFELIADGTNVPVFSGMEEDGGSGGYLNTTGIPNQITIERATNRTLWSAKQAIGATPIDTTPPTASSAAVATATSTVVNVTMSEAMDTSFTPAASAWTVSGHTVTNFAWGTTTRGDITVSSAFVNGEAARTAAYTQPGTNNARDVAGNLLANFSGLSITNNVATVPGAPTIGTATGGNAQLSQAFSAPASNGGSAITGYTVRVYKVSDDSFVASNTGAGSPIVVTGLTNGTAVYGKAKATNAIGTGSESAASNSVTPATTTQQLRLTGLISLVESGSGPYTYTGDTTGHFNSSPVGGVADHHLPASTDGWAQATLNVANEVIWGLSTVSSTSNYVNMNYYIYATGAFGTNYQIGANSTIGAASTAVASAAGDVLRMDRTGSTVTAKISKDGGSTFTTINTWTSASAAALYPQGEATNTAQFTAPTGSASLV